MLYNVDEITEVTRIPLVLSSTGCIKWLLLGWYYVPKLICGGKPVLRMLDSFLQY